MRHLFRFVPYGMILICGVASAQTIVQPPPKAAAVESVVDSSLRPLDEYIEKARQDWGVPGLAVAIVDGDRVVLSKGYGSRRIGTDEPVDPNTLFAIASNTKAFTAAALAILVDEGKLHWDDRVQKYLPALELYDPYVTYDLRIRDLLCHRSGLGTFSGDLLWYGTSYTPGEVLQRARHLPPAGAFRAHYGYSNLMFLAAGEVIAAVSGPTWEKFVEERILRPLGMTRTATSVSELVLLDNFATPHKTDLEGSRPIPWVRWDNMAAAGGLISSVHDMTHWIRLQLNRGKLPDGTQLFSEDQSREMWQAQIALPVSPRSSQRFPSMHFRAYGLGWSLSDYQGRKLVAHGGAYDGMYSMVLLVPEENWGMVVLTNSMTSISEALIYRALDDKLGVPPRDWSQENRELFLKDREAFHERVQSAITPTAQDTKPSHELTAYTGTYRDTMYGDARIHLQDGGLVLALLPNPTFVADLEHLHYDTFVLRWRTESAWFDEGTAHFVADARGQFGELKLDVPNDDLWFHELNFKRVAEDVAATNR